MKKQNLLCIDSDGCAMDTMEYKHIHCFGPAFIQVFGPFTNDQAVLDEWNRVNLYSLQRGINRFVGALELLKKYRSELEGLAGYEQFVLSTPTLSYHALATAYEQTLNPCMKQVMQWSNITNEMIEAMAMHAKPFAHVKQTLAYASDHFMLAVVSSANEQALLQEWEHFGLREYCNVMYSQNQGTKSECIKRLKKEEGYDGHQILMVGDALGDYAAAKANGAWFYPILARQEEASWLKLYREVLPLHEQNQITDALQEQWLQAFRNNLEKGEQ